jgi:hypothetical protein
MALWPPPHKLGDSISQTIRYSLQFSYPLSAREVWFWQVRTHYSLSQVTEYLRLLNAGGSLINSHGQYSLPGFSDYFVLRNARRKTSLQKMNKARNIGRILQIFPTIQAVFLTGTVAMLNCQKDDDIDLFIVTLPHTLWISRFFTVLYLKISGLRRPPYVVEHSSPRVSDTVCDNLWLDTHHLEVGGHSLFIAHEILQAICLWDRGGIFRRLLLSNSWVGEYLPAAYSSVISTSPQTPPSRSWGFLLSILLAPFNMIFFLIQFLYMFPHRTREKIGLGFAYFHPSPQAQNYGILDL